MGARTSLKKAERIVNTISREEAQAIMGTLQCVIYRGYAIQTNWRGDWHIHTLNIYFTTLEATLAFIDTLPPANPIGTLEIDRTEVYGHWSYRHICPYTKIIDAGPVSARSEEYTKGYTLWRGLIILGEIK